VLSKNSALNLIESAKRKREEEKAQKENINKGISNYFTKGPVVAQPKAKVWLIHEPRGGDANYFRSQSRPRRTTIS
jgi:hypothetical protein